MAPWQRTEKAPFRTGGEMGVSEFRGPGLADAQWEQIETLAASLNAKQLLWVSGFFAGVEHQTDVPAGRGVPASVVEVPSATQSRRLTVLFGSETGNSAALAASLADRFKTRQRSVRLVDMATYRARDLKDEQDLLIITSTCGEGDPPPPAVGFSEFVEGRKPPKLAVLGARLAREGIPATLALPTFLQSYLANLVTAAVRLIPLGQTDGQLAIAELEDSVLAASVQAKNATIDDLGSAAFMVDLASMAHEAAIILRQPSAPSWRTSRSPPLQSNHRATRSMPHCARHAGA
ncbi:UreF protein [Rhizobiales bacterium GAS113]|nr:UreF protein [Rhizobiales bacterium GAS113]